MVPQIGSGYAQYQGVDSICSDAQLVNNYGETPLDLGNKFGLQDMCNLLHLSCLSSSSEMSSQCKQNLHPGEFS